MPPTAASPPAGLVQPRKMHHTAAFWRNGPFRPSNSHFGQHLASTPSLARTVRKTTAERRRAPGVTMAGPDPREPAAGKRKRRRTENRPRHGEPHEGNGNGKARRAAAARARLPHGAPTVFAWSE